MNKITTLDIIALLLLIIGGLNWGLVGLWNIDVVATLLGTMSVLSRLVYILVGIAAMWSTYLMIRVMGPQ